ncbi:MAG: hypothetical protein K8S27_08460 [Candidatus Omnitrophica bacterium]|nr:hypothetical protein [Candidatus Omnitrophota bacterium]
MISRNIYIKNKFLFFAVLFVFSFSLILVENISYADDIQAVLDSDDGSSAFSIQDSSSTEVMSIDSNGAVTTSDNITVQGGDATIGAGTTAYPGRFILHDGDGGDSFTTTIQSNDDVNASYILTLPTDDGNQNQSLLTDGSGNLSWGAPTGGSGAYDLNGETLTIDLDGDTFLDAATDDQLDIAVGGSDVVHLTGSSLYPDIDGSLDLGSMTNEYKDIYIDGTAHVDSLSAELVNIVSGTIDNVTIGGTTAAAGTFTSLSTTGDATVSGGDVTMGAGTIAYPGRLMMHDNQAGDSFTVTVQANDTIAASFILTLPGDDGSQNQSLITDGQGNLSWGAPSGGTGAYDLNGAILTIDADADTSLDATTDDQIDITIGGSDIVHLVPTSIYPETDDSVDLGRSSNEFRDLYIDGTAHIDSLSSDTVTIDGGSMNNVTIGGTTAAAGSFTTLTASTSFVTTGDATVSGGDVTVGDGTTAYPARFVMHDNQAGDSFTMTVQANDTIAASFILTFPSDDGISAQSLITDGSGNLSWGAPAGGTGAYDLNGSLLTVDADGDTTIQADTDDQIDIQVAGTDQFSITDGAITPTTDNDIDLGSLSSEYKDLYVDGVGYIDSVSADTLTATNVDLDVGTIDNVTIGGTTAAAGTFTSIIASTSFATTGDATVSGGDVTVGDGTTAYAGRMVMHDTDGGDSFTMTVQANADIGADFILTLPANDGTSGQQLTTDGDGNLTWDANGSGSLDDTYNNGNTVDVDGSAVMLTVSDTDNNQALSVVQNDVTNNPVAMSVTNAGTGDALQLINSNAGTVGPTLVMHHDSASPSDGDEVSRIELSGDDSAGVRTEYARIYSLANDVTDGTEDGELIFMVADEGTITEAMRIDESGNLGLGETVPAAKLEIDTDDGDNVVGLVIDQDDVTNDMVALQIENAGTGDDILIVNTEAGATGAVLTLQHDSVSPADDDDIGIIDFTADDDGGTAFDFGRIYVESNDVSDGTEDANMIFSVANDGTLEEVIRIDESAQIGVGTSTPSAKLDVNGSVSLSGTGSGFDANNNTIYFQKQEDTGATGAETIDWRNGNKVEHTLTGNVTYTFTDPLDVCNLLLMLKQDGTGSQTVTWPAGVQWPGGTAPTLSTSANAIDIVSFYFDGINYYGSASLDFQ